MNYPDDIRHNAFEALMKAAGSVRVGGEPHLAICAALLAEREAQRERDAKIVEDMWGEMAEDVAIAIRSQDTPTPQDET